MKLNVSSLLQLKSVFDTSIMPYTNYTYDFKGMIDYIFYPVRSMKPLGYLGPISQEWLDDNKVVGCPHPHITSGKVDQRERNEKSVDMMQYFSLQTTSPFWPRSASVPMVSPRRTTPPGFPLTPTPSHPASAAWETQWGEYCIFIVKVLLT